MEVSGILMWPCTMREYPRITVESTVHTVSRPYNTTLSTTTHWAREFTTMARCISAFRCNYHKNVIISNWRNFHLISRIVVRCMDLGRTIMRRPPCIRIRKPVSRGAHWLDISRLISINQSLINQSIRVTPNGKSPHSSPFVTPFSTLSTRQPAINFSTTRFVIFTYLSVFIMYMTFSNL